MAVQNMTSTAIAGAASSTGSVSDPAMTSNLRLVSIPDVNTAVGVAARLTMSHPAFARERFGTWMLVLEAQAIRGHQLFVMNSEDRAVGFVGYALVEQSAGRRWLAGETNAFPDHGDRNDCIIINAWIAEDGPSLTALLYAFRKVAVGRREIFFKRVRKDGSYRSAKLSVTGMVEEHIARFERSIF